jgi:uncharacterized membrane protein
MDRLRLTLVTVALLALGLWIGGMVALGAIAAPVVFGTVPAPASADAMTIVFRRFDKVAIACVVVVLAVEALLALRSTVTRVDVARGLLAAVGCICAITVGVFVSPRIEALHRGGAIRGLGADGLELESFHRFAERLGTVELAVAALLVALHVFSLGRGGSGSGRPSHTLGKKKFDEAKAAS